MGTRFFRDTAVGVGIPAAARKSSGSADLALLLAMVGILVFGLIMVFSASWDFSLAVYQNPTQMFNRQVLWVVIGSILAYIVSRIDYHLWRKLVVPAMIGTIILLGLVLFLNDPRLGAVRTILNGSIQPSELAKVVTVIYLAVWMHSKREQLHDIQWGLIPLAAILGIIGGLIYLQPDLSATATVFVLGGLLFFLAGGDLKQIAFLLIVAIIFGAMIVQVSPTGRERIGTYLEGIRDPLQASYHVRRSLEAIVKGGWFGVGIGRSNTKLIGLPVPPTDSIFAVIAEELGLIGAAATVAMFGFIIWRGLRIANKAPDLLGSLLAAGLTYWIATEAVINMLVMVGLMPFAGNALPFISAGGSSMVTSLFAMGILFNISRQGAAGESIEEEWRSFGAIFDLRRGNGRRRLSRVGRNPGTER